MSLCFKKFIHPYFAEYTSWFQDPELNSELGLMDVDWLNWVLHEDEADGITWAVFDGEEMVGVVEIGYDPQGILPAVIRAIAVKPGRRRQGIGSVILHDLFRMNAQKGIVDYCVFIKPNNSASRRFFEKFGFIPISSQPNKQGFLDYRRTKKTSLKPNDFSAAG